MYYNKFDGLINLKIEKKQANKQTAQFKNRSGRPSIYPQLFPQYLIPTVLIKFAAAFPVAYPVREAVKKDGNCYLLLSSGPHISKLGQNDSSLSFLYK